jgi:hypothetical protein
MPRLIRKLSLRLRSLFHGGKAEKELDEEFRFHLENQIAEHVAHGMSPQEARLEALRELGGIEQHKEECRDARGLRWLDELQQDLRYGLSRLISQRVFTAATILILGLGIGANSAMFSLVNSILFRPLGVSEPKSLIHVYETPPYAGQYVGFSYPAYQHIRSHSEVFTDVLAFADFSTAFTSDNTSEVITGNVVSGNYFNVLGLKAVCGRIFGPEEDKTESNAVVMISDALWRRLRVGVLAGSNHGDLLREHGSIRIPLRH